MHHLKPLWGGRSYSEVRDVGSGVRAQGSQVEIKGSGVMGKVNL